MEKKTRAKDIVILFFCTILGLAAGGAACLFFGSEPEYWQNAIPAFCASPKHTAFRMLFVTVGFTAVILLLGISKRLRLIIYPAVCFRCMGLGALLCGMIAANGYEGLCFAALVALPYTVISCATVIHAGEFSLGMIGSSLCPKGPKIAKALLLHNVKMWVFYIALSALACAAFTGFSAAFAEYLM